MHINKEELFKRVWRSLLFDQKPIEISMKYLWFTFGFKRKAGLDIALTQLIFPSRTESEIQMASPRVIIMRVDEWCKEAGFLGRYQADSDTYLFFAIIKPQIKP